MMHQLVPYYDINGLQYCCTNNEFGPSLDNYMISESNVWTLNRKTANELYLETWARDIYEISENDSLDGTVIAMQRPHEAGDGVYTYRVMLNMLDYEFYGMPYNALVTPDQNFTFKVIPNPASGNVTIEIPLKDNEHCNIEVISVTGESLLTTSSSKSNGILQFDVSHLPGGCYIVKAHTESGITGHAKLCVIH